MGNKKIEDLSNNGFDNPNLLNAVREDLEYSQKLYFHMDESLKNTLKFIYWFYATVFTATLAIINFSGFLDTSLSYKTYIISQIVLYIVVLNNMGKSMVSDAIAQYLLKEKTFKSLIVLRSKLESIYGVNLVNLDDFRKKDRTGVTDISWLYSWLCMSLGFFSAVAAFLMLINRAMSEDLSQILWFITFVSYLFSAILSFSFNSSLGKYQKTSFEKENELWVKKELNLQEKDVLKQKPKVNKKLIVMGLFLILIGIYVKINF